MTFKIVALATVKLRESQQVLLTQKTDSKLLSRTTEKSTCNAKFLQHTNTRLLDMDSYKNFFAYILPICREAPLEGFA